MKTRAIALLAMSAMILGRTARAQNLPPHLPTLQPLVEPVHPLLLPGFLPAGAEKNLKIDLPAVPKTLNVEAVNAGLDKHADTRLTVEKARHNTYAVASLCDIKAHPEKYVGKSLQFSAVVTHGFEDSMVEDANCKWGEKSAPGVWMEFGGTQKTGTTYFGDAESRAPRTKNLTMNGIEMPLTQDVRFERLRARMAEQVTGSTALVHATVRGFLFAKPQVLFGETAYKGYGHMGCCMLFVLTDVVSVDPKPVDQTLYAHHPRPQSQPATVRAASLTLKAGGR